MEAKRTSQSLTADYVQKSIPEENLSDIELMTVSLPRVTLFSFFGKEANYFVHYFL